MTKTATPRDDLFLVPLESWDAVSSWARAALMGILGPPAVAGYYQRRHANGGDGDLHDVRLSFILRGHGRRPARPSEEG